MEFDFYADRAISLFDCFAHHISLEYLEQATIDQAILRKNIAIPSVLIGISAKLVADYVANMVSLYTKAYAGNSNKRCDLSRAPFTLRLATRFG